MTSSTHQAPPSFLTPAEIAAQLGVSVKTVQGWIQRRACGILPVHSADGRRVYLHASAIDQLRRPAAASARCHGDGACTNPRCPRHGLDGELERQQLTGRGA